eukprot:m.171596 g.171596  ORF g.171596 m.171596 type:complete len:967 (+) comp14554_c0_seq1:291-3191(+)
MSTLSRTTQIFVAVPAESSCLAGVHHARWWEAGLTAHGITQAQELAAQLPPVSHLIAGPLASCVQTAQQVAEVLQVDMSVDSGLIAPLLPEHFEGISCVDELLTATQLHNQDPPLLESALNWESVDDMSARVAQLAHRLHAHAYAIQQPVLIITDREIARELVAAITGNHDVGCTSAFAAWAKVEIELDSTSTSLIQPFSPPLRVTPGQLWARDHVNNWGAWFVEEGFGQDSPVSVLEIGSWEGLSTSWWLHNVCKYQEQSRVIAVDHFDNFESEAGQQRYERFRYNVRATGQGHKVQIVPKFSFAALAHDILPLGEQVDLVYVDGDHTARGTMLDAMLAWQALRKGGFMLFDDYEWPVLSDYNPQNPPSKDHWSHPKPGIDAFLKLMNHELTVLYRGYQVLVQKTSESQVDFPVMGRDTIVVAMALDAMSTGPGLIRLNSFLEHSDGRQVRLVLFTSEDVDRSLFDSLASSTAKVYWMPLPTVRGFTLSQACQQIPGQFSHFVWLTATGPVFKGHIQHLWDCCPANAAVAMFPTPAADPENVAHMTLVNRSISAKTARCAEYTIPSPSSPFKPPFGPVLWLDKQLHERLFDQSDLDGLSAPFNSTRQLQTKDNVCSPVVIACACDASYAHACGVMLSSLAKHCSQEVVVYLLDFGLTDKDKEYLRSVTSDKKMALNVLDLDGLPAGGLPTGKLPQSTWGRLLVIRDKRVHTDRLLFLDCDTLIRGDIAELWQSSLHGKPLGAVVDFGHPHGHDTLAKHGWKVGCDLYFNAGVLLMDVAALRKNCDEWFEFAVGQSGLLKHQDQDVMNLWLQGQWHSLPLKWNAQGLGTYANFRVKAATDCHLTDALFTQRELDDLARDCVIVHFTGDLHPRPSAVLNPWAPPSSKPWGYWKAKGHPHAGDWWETLSQTPWKSWTQRQNDTEAQVAYGWLSDMDAFADMVDVEEAKLATQRCAEVLREAQHSKGSL